jgi:hypothetical protein
MKDTTTSPGNAGSRGSEGQPNSGARGNENSTEAHGNARAPEADTDLRGTPARGGGGAGSNSSRSQDAVPDEGDDQSPAKD